MSHGFKGAEVSILSCFFVGTWSLLRLWYGFGIYEPPCGLILRNIDIGYYCWINFQKSKPGARIQLAASGKYRFEKKVTHIFPLEEAEEALKMAKGQASEYPIKVMLKP